MALQFLCVFVLFLCCSPISLVTASTINTNSVSQGLTIEERKARAKAEAAVALLKVNSALHNASEIFFRARQVNARAEAVMRDIQATASEVVSSVNVTEELKVVEEVWHFSSSIAKMIEKEVTIINGIKNLAEMANKQMKEDPNGDQIANLDVLIRRARQAEAFARQAKSEEIKAMRGANDASEALRKAEAAKKQAEIKILKVKQQKGFNTGALTDHSIVTGSTNATGRYNSDKKKSNVNADISIRSITSTYFSTPLLILFIGTLACTIFH